VKLQLFRAEWLLSEEAMLAAYQVGHASAYEMLKKLELSVEQMLGVRGLAKELGLGFVVTPFSLENLQEMRLLDVDAVKIASPDAVNWPLIEAMLELGKPMLISTGTASVEELEEARRLCEDHATVFLHCVSMYPTPGEAAGMGRMKAMREQLRCEVGYSDHTNSGRSAVLAVGMGARVIEKHLTYDCNAKGPDHAASCDGRRFKEYVEQIRGAEAAMRWDEARDVEGDVRKVSRQSVCAAADLKKGQVVKREDVTIKRPGTGMAAGRLKEVVGKKLKRDVKKNWLLREGDVG
jgi:sialic acid synthase SpsE